MYISGYPRCGNTFARTAFLAANPNAKVQSHRHIPTFVLESIRRGVPGLILLRSPLDAAVSWAIHENQTLEEAIAYWNDYYEVLMPVRSQLFVARFEDVTTNFGGVINHFNAKWGTSFTPFDHTPENAALCFRVTEAEHRQPSGEIQEMRVCRPSAERRSVKDAHLSQLNQSGFLRDELARAREMYESFLHDRGKDERQSSTRLVPGKADSGALQIGAPV
jgi:hypothetical protein